MKVAWKILVADDEVVNRKLIAEILKKSAVCEHASDGVEALRMYEEAQDKKEPYDAIFLDIAMPNVDGLQVLKKIREKEKNSGVEKGRGVAIIMVTAYKHPFVDAMKEGCDDYIIKPVDPYLLTKIVDEKIGRVTKK